MKRSMALVATLALAAVGCDNGGTNPTVHDMAMHVVPHDAGGGAPVGASCTKNTDCVNSSLSTPTCMKGTGASSGLCTAKCTTDNDCSSDGTSVCMFAQDGMPDSGTCTKVCMADTDCSDGIGCWITLSQTANVCFRNDQIAEFGVTLTLDCDPTANNGACTFAGSPLPGGCDRQILGSGMAGHCRLGCNLGVGTCPNTPALAAIMTPDHTYQQNCYLVDLTAGTDGTPNPLGDKFKGPLCEPDVQVALSATNMATHFIPDGSECLDPTDTTMTHFFDICDLGSQCFTYSRDATKTADNKCHQLCYLQASFMPPDAGEPFSVDGGMQATNACNSGTCSDIFGVGANPTSPTQPIGLCL